METRRWTAVPEHLTVAAELLRQGRLVAFPTETVYGLGADARNGAAVARIYEAKGRPRFNPLIAHVTDLDAARREGIFDARAVRLATAFWPGPLTLVVPTAPGCSVSELARAGLGSVALRVPGHPVATDLLGRAGCPVAAPSANLSGRISPTAAAHVLKDLDGRIDAVIDAGETVVGLESTIVACVSDRVELLRPGGVSREAIEAVLGQTLAGTRNDDAPRLAPGMMASHYAPRAILRLNAAEIAPDETVLDFGGRFLRAKCRYRLDLSPAADLRTAAAHLFDHLHRLDAVGADRIAVAPVPSEGLGEAINDRLRRAAAPRP